MNRTILKLYDFLKAHRPMGMASLVVVTTLMAIAFLSLQYREDISDFLPVDGQRQEALSVYQDISGSSRVFAIFECTDTTSTDYDLLVQAVDQFVEFLQINDPDSLVKGLTYKIDESRIEEVTDFVYENIPYFLTSDYYDRIETAVSQPDFVATRLQEGKQLLMLPAGSLLAENLQRDPLNLFTPASMMLAGAGQQVDIESYEGYILTPDAQKMIVMLTSPFGNSETDKNSQLISLLLQARDKVAADCEGINIRMTGGPVIAVGNAQQIKSDSIVSVTLAVVLILALLLYSFRSWRNVLLVMLSIAWGWLFALAGLAIVHDKISIIVVGISSVILGIAVNYPLHLIAHLSHASSVRGALKEVVTPLLIGNITTVGAFCSLIPLNSLALSDLGIFSAFLLVGTILFVIIYLPHLVHHHGPHEQAGRGDLLTRICNLPIPSNRYALLAIAITTIVLGYFSTLTTFNTDMNNINYMSEEQRDNMKYFQSLTQGINSAERNVYVVSSDTTLDGALNKNNQAAQAVAEIVAADSGLRHSSCAQFITSKKEQAERIDRWNAFIKKHRSQLVEQLDAHAAAEGFAQGAFDEFKEILSRDYKPSIDVSILMPIFASNLSIDSLGGHYHAIDIITLPSEMTECVADTLKKKCPEQLTFDIQSLNSSISKSLSDNFNFIGWACGIIVFIFLWISFGRLELALIAFCPMIIGWLWILGVMALFDIQFNIVNIILATFIFGQGDDYSIFITEGCIHEYAYRKKMLTSYRRSIIISALIMFIGIGALIFAKHPALYSLAQVTIIGMTSVVVTSFIVPPILYGWLTTRRGKYRYRPIRLVPLLRTFYCGAVWLSQLLLCYMLACVARLFGNRQLRSRLWFHQLVSFFHKVDLRLIPGVKLRVDNPHNETFTRPCVIVCNHQSMLDPAYLLSLSPKILMVAGERSSMNPVVRGIFKWLSFYTVKADNHSDWIDSCIDRDIDIFREYVSQGYSIAIFPEGVRNPRSSIVRYHKGSFYLAQKLDIDILPVFIHGLNYVTPIGSMVMNAHPVTMVIEQRITKDSSLYDADCTAFTKKVHRFYIQRYTQLASSIETADFYLPLVKDRYLYKGLEISATVSKHLKQNRAYAGLLKGLKPDDNIVIKNCGYGELALLAALLLPKAKITAYDNDPTKLSIARASAEGFVDNVNFLQTTIPDHSSVVIELDPNGNVL